MYIYGIIVLICIYILYFGCYKLKSPFWSRQPVFHYHNLSYWLFPPGIIKKNLSTSKYLDSNIVVKNIDYTNILPNKIVNSKTATENVTKHTTNSFSFNDSDIKQCILLIQKYYLNEGVNTYNPDAGEITAYFYGHIKPCFIGYYKLNTPLIQNGNIKDIIQHDKIISTITSRPLYFYIRNGSDTTNQNKHKQIHFTSQYVDFLVTHKSYRKQGFTPKMIYTFAHDIINTKQNDVSNFLFKNEGTTISIIPFVTYNCFVFDTVFWNIKPHDPIYKLTKLNESNFSIIERTFQTTLEGMFETIAIPHIHAIKELITRKVWNVFILHYKEDILGYYFFRNHEFYYDGGKVFECFGSICVRDEMLFVNNFYNCIDFLKKNNQLKYLYIENLSNNNILLKYILKEKSYISKLRYNYYFYNNIIRPVLGKDTIILN